MESVSPSAFVVQPEAALSLAHALLNASPSPLLLLDADLRVVRATPSFCAVFGMHHDQVQGRSLAELGTGEWNAPALRLLLENALRDGPDWGDQEALLTKTGAEPRQLVVSAHKIIHDDKQNTRVLLTINDVTASRRAVQLNTALLQEKDDLLRERDVLHQEMEHRIANSLQLIASVLRLKARAVTSEESRLHLKDAHDRVMSVAAVQRYLKPGVGEVEIGPYLTKLCEGLTSSMIFEAGPLAITVRAAKGSVTSEDAVSLGLIVTELVINALKHAFPGNRAGRVTVRYEKDAGGWMLSVADDGVGSTPATAQARSGLGVSIVETLARQLDAEVILPHVTKGFRTNIVHGTRA